MTTASPFCFFFQAEDGIRDLTVTGVQTCALPIYPDVTRTRVDRAELPQYFPIATPVIKDDQAGLPWNEALENWPLVSKVAGLAVPLASPITLIKGGRGSRLVIHNRCF